jgi:TRAP transporter TAXI family solute receptor
LPAETQPRYPAPDVNETERNPGLRGRRPTRAGWSSVVLTAALGVLSGGCGQQTDVPRVSLITGSTGSDWYRIGSAVALHANLAFEGQPITAVPGAGGISNPARVGLMPGDFGVSFLPFLRLAYDGEPPYRQAYPELRHVAALIPNTFQLLASPTLGIRTLEQLREQRKAVRIGTGPPGSGEELLLREALLANGITYDDIRSWGGRIDLLGSGERADLFRDYHVDMIAFNSNAPSPLISELLLSRPAPFIGLDDRTQRTLAERWHVQPAELPAGTYEALTAPVPTVSMTFGIFTTADMPDALVFEMVKAIAAHKSYLETVHVGFKAWEPRQMTENGGTPVHPGAERFYREQGWND